MSDNKKAVAPRVSLVTPRGVFKYPHLIEPDYGTAEYPIKNGEFNLRLVLDRDGTAALLASVSKVITEGKEWAKGEDAKRKPAARAKSPLNFMTLGTPVYDSDDQETDAMEFKIKTAASGADRKTGKVWHKKVHFIDAQRAGFSPPSVWGGTVGKVKVTASAFFIPGSGMAGVSLYLEVVQIIELVEAGGSSADTTGFDDEDGYIAPEVTEEEVGESEGDKEDTPQSDPDYADDF